MRKINVFLAFKIITFAAFMLSLNPSLAFGQNSDFEESPETESASWTGAFLFDTGFSMGGSSTTGPTKIGLSIDVHPEDIFLSFTLYAGYIGEFNMLSQGYEALGSFSFGAGMRTTFGWVIEPFAGIAFYAGGTGDSEPAEYDNIDNDDDGSIDEDGETRFIPTSLMFSVIAELGIRIRLKRFIILGGWQWMAAASTGGSGSNMGLFISAGIVY